MEDKLQETTQQLADEEEKAKGLAKQKAKQDALIADLEERLRNSERVRIFALIVRFLCSCVTQCHRVTYRLCFHCVVDCLFLYFQNGAIAEHAKERTVEQKLNQF